jgi:hypothetical protein
MDQYELIKVLSRLDEYLSSSFDVVIVGGAAMILHFGARRATRDVDVLVLKGDASVWILCITLAALEWIGRNGCAIF